MVRALALVAVVAIMAIVVLAIWFSRRREKVRADQLRRQRQTIADQQRLIDDIRSEVMTQLSAGHTNFEYTLSLITDHDRKELTQ